MHLFGLLVLPALVAGGFFLFFKTTITWKEFLAQLGISCVLVVSGYYLARWGAMQDTEHLNGRIVKKDHGTEGCCHCRSVCTGTDSKGNCTGYTTVCDHSWDYYWALDTTVGRITIEDCSGWDITPSAWTNAVVGEPATVNHLYTNYLKADPDSLLIHAAVEKYGKRIPPFPKVYGYYKVDPVLSDGVAVPKGWQKAIREVNADLGASHQVDVVVLLTDVQDPVYAQAVESKWLYGPKNSATVVIGVKDGTVSWANLVTFSRVENLKIRVRDDLHGMSLDGMAIPDKIRGLIAGHFKRTAMAEFEYLARSAEPSTGWLIFLYIFGLALNVGLGIFMHKNELFEDGCLWSPRYSRNWRWS